MLVIASIAFTAVPVSALADEDPAEVRVWVDAGHGGKDPGARGGGLQEKDTNLQIARIVAKEARKRGFIVGTTRDSDYFVPLVTRARRANAWGADVFVSIHSNSMGERPRGHMTIFRSAAGARLGSDIMRELSPLTEYADIGNRSDYRGLVVLKGTRAPAVIVELLSVSSSGERKVLTSPAQQRKMARAVVRGIARNVGAMTDAERDEAREEARGSAREEGGRKEGDEAREEDPGKLAEALEVAERRAKERKEADRLVEAARRKASREAIDRFQALLDKAETDRLADEKAAREEAEAVAAAETAARQAAEASRIAEQSAVIAEAWARAAARESVDATAPPVAVAADSAWGKVIATATAPAQPIAATETTSAPASEATVTPAVTPAPAPVPSQETSTHSDARGLEQRSRGRLRERRLRRRLRRSHRDSLAG